MMEEIKYGVTESDLDWMIKELEEAKLKKAPYNKDQVEYLKGVIEMMDNHIGLALAILKQQRE